MNDQTGKSGDYVAPVEIDRIMEMIPHRYPFLLIDRLVEMVPDDHAVALKNVTMNEPQFQGHFPGAPVMPGVLIVEAMAQASALLVVVTLGPESEGKLVYFMAIDNARFRKPVGPGDTMLIHVRKLRNRGAVWKFACEVKIGDVLAAEATITAMIIND